MRVELAVGMFFIVDDLDFRGMEENVLLTLISQKENTAVSGIGNLPVQAQFKFGILLFCNQVATATFGEGNGTVSDLPITACFVLLIVTPAFK